MMGAEGTNTITLKRAPRWLRIWRAPGFFLRYFTLVWRLNKKGRRPPLWDVVKVAWGATWLLVKS